MFAEEASGLPWSAGNDPVNALLVGCSRICPEDVLEKVDVFTASGEMTSDPIVQREDSKIGLQRGFDQVSILLHEIGDSRLRGIRVDRSAEHFVMCVFECHDSL